MAAAWIAAIAAVAGTAMAGAQYASMPGPPKPPDLAAASRAGIEAESATLADRRRMESAAQQGASTLNFDYTQTTYTAAQRQTLADKLQSLQRQLTRLQAPSHPGRNGNGETPQQPNQNPDVAQARQEAALRAQIQDISTQFNSIPQGGGTVYLDKKGKVVPQSQAMADFTGYGTADVQGKVAQQNAQNVLDLQAKYGPQFIEEALKQQEQADPEGTAARKQSYALIQKMEAEHPDRPVAALLDSQVADQLHAGKNLDSVSDSVLKDAVAKAQAARGSSSSDPNLDFSAPLTTGLEGEARQMAAQQKATNWLASGQTPEDVEYRRRQAIEGDLGAFVNGRTPESQFPTLSGAQRGPAPFYQGTPLSGASSATGPAASNAAMSVWGQQLGYNSNQANPWMAGLSTLLSGINTYTNASTVPRTG